MNDKPLVSVIIPVYNREGVVEECIRSVQNQTYQQFEILLIDDGSTDRSVEICTDLAARDSRIRLFTGTHTGVSGTRNIGLDTANGDYVFFLDSDDIIHPQLLQALILGMEAHNAAMAATNRRHCQSIVWEKVKPIFLRDFVTAESDYYPHEKALQATFGTEKPFAVMGGVMMRRDWIGDTRFRTDLFIGEDFYFSYENLIKGADLVFLKQYGYLSRLHDSNTSWQYDYNAFWTRFYRRKLVWESEEAFGRTEYAAQQKQGVFPCFTTCFQRNNPYGAEARKMRGVLKEYRDAILPTLPAKSALLYRFYLLFPGMTWLFIHLRDCIKAFRSRRRRNATGKGAAHNR